jgi:hypothetical protein
LVDVDEVYYRESRQRHFKTEYCYVLLDRHEVDLLSDADEDEGLQEYSAA